MYTPHKIAREKFCAIRDHVIVHEMLFDARITNGGIYIPNDNGKGHGIRPRWGRVYAVGPEQKEIKVGQWIMIAHGRWTRGIDIDDGTVDHKRTIRKIDPKDILLISDGQERPQDDTQSDAVHVAKQTRD